MIITIDNHNYGSFKYEKTIGFMDYHGEIVAEIPIPQQIVSAHRKINLRTSANFMADKVVNNPYFLRDT